jgi:hypothetical protein
VYFFLRKITATGTAEKKLRSAFQKKKKREETSSCAGVLEPKVKHRLRLVLF